LRARTAEPHRHWFAALANAFFLLSASSLPSFVSAQATSAAQSRTLEILLQQAQALIKAKQAEQAFGLLAAQTTVYAGKPDFDYLLGIAALDTKRPGVAVLALERVLAVQPNNLPARAELGRALFELRELDSAKKELATVQSQVVPDEVNQSLTRYLDAIKRLQQAQSQQTNVWVETYLGYDTNLNSGSRLGEWLLADGTRLTPSADSKVRKGSSYRLSAGIEHQRRLTPALVGFGQASINDKEALVSPNVSFVTVDGALGVAHTRQSTTWTVSLNLQHTQLQHAALRNLAGASVQWQESVSKSSKVGLYGQLYSMNFPNSASQNARRFNLGATAAVDLGYAVVAGAAGYTSEASRSARPEYSYKAPNARVVVDFVPAAQWRASASLSLERRQFDGVQLLFEGLTRKETDTELRLQAERQWGNHWVITPSLSYQRNRSTIGPNDFNRFQLGLATKYRF
jgi:outer membrane protein